LNYKSILKGWGILDDIDEIQPDVLMQVKLTIYNNSMCKNVSQSLKKNWGKLE
jgi:hypothetical protein